MHCRLICKSQKPDIAVLLGFGREILGGEQRCDRAGHVIGESILLCDLAERQDGAECLRTGCGCIEQRDRRFALDDEFPGDDARFRDRK